MNSAYSDVPYGRTLQGIKDYLVLEHGAKNFSEILIPENCKFTSAKIQLTFDKRDGGRESLYLYTGSGSTDQEPRYFFYQSESN